MTTTAPFTNFKEAYGSLQKHAATLRDQREPNIDDLLNTVTESQSAYQLCTVRIDAVERALQDELQGDGSRITTEAPFATFREAFDTLQKHATTLRDQCEPNIDDLQSTVTESRSAHAVCIKRIDAVERALQEALQKNGTPSAT